MKISLSCFVFILASFFSTFAFSADVQTFQLKSVVDKGLSGEALLRLIVVDSQPKSGVCYYYLKTLQYSPVDRILTLDIYQENCVNDAFGLSKGEVDWAVPTSLLTDGAEIQVVVNQAKAGSLVYVSGNKNFRVKN